MKQFIDIKLGEPVFVVNDDYRFKSNQTPIAVKEIVCMLSFGYNGYEAQLHNPYYRLNTTLTISSPGRRDVKRGYHWPCVQNGYGRESKITFRCSVDSDLSYTMYADESELLKDYPNINVIDYKERLNLVID